MYEALPSLQIPNFPYYFLIEVSLVLNAAKVIEHCYLSLICGEISFE
jgi:hypothetical protein